MDISYQEAYTMNKEEARRLIIETYLDTGNFSLRPCSAQMGKKIPGGRSLRC